MEKSGHKKNLFKNKLDFQFFYDKVPTTLKEK